MNVDVQMRQAQKLEALGQLAGSVAHDFNNLLTAIFGQADILLDDIPQDSPLRDAVLEIQKAAQSAARLTSQLLSFGRRRPMNTVILDIDQEIDRLGEMLARLLGERVELHLDLRGSAHISVDQGLIEQVLLNLAVNARDAMPDGGTLLIGTRATRLADAAEERSLGLAADRCAILTVSDTGIGMDAATQARIFEPFFSTKGEGGTGLGLATVYGLVKQHDGAIAVRSVPGEGTTFEIYLPCVDDDTIPQTRCAAALTDAPVSRRVLLVEDDPRVRDLVARTLTRRGYAVRSVSTAESAVDLLQSADPFDLVITDIVLPRMGGLDLAAEARRLHPGIAVLLMSGYTDVKCDGPFVRKPFTPTDLLNEAAAAMRSARA